MLMPCTPLLGVAARLGLFFGLRTPDWPLLGLDVEAAIGLLAASVTPYLANGLAFDGIPLCGAADVRFSLRSLCMRFLLGDGGAVPAGNMWI